MRHKVASCRGPTLFRRMRLQAHFSGGNLGRGVFTDTSLVIDAVLWATSLSVDGFGEVPPYGNQDPQVQTGTTIKKGRVA